MKDILVSIQCITFNHVHYLQQALESFLMQKTDFGFEIIVHDDCSTDGTTEVLQRYADQYPETIVPIYEAENQWKKTGMKPVFRRMTELSRGKYIAYCEGDDFWQDPLKLQKQVDAMERSPEATLCYTGFQTVDSEGIPIYIERFEGMNKVSRSGNMFFSLLEQNIILTPTTLFRKEIFYSKVYCDTSLRMDYFAFLSAAALGLLVYIPERTACYRLSPNGAMATQSKWVIEVCAKIRDYFLILFLKREIEQRWTLKAVMLVVQLFNRAIRKKMSGDRTEIDNLLIISPLPRTFYFLAWLQIKYQNLEFQINNK